MNKNPVKPEIDFNEALRRIAHTPKAVVDKVVNNKGKRYSDEKAVEKPPRAKRPKDVLSEGGTE